MTVRRGAAVVRYQLADAVRAQRVLVPVFLFVVVAGILLSGDRTAAPGPWPATVLVLYGAAAWIGLAVANGEDPVQRHVTVASAGGHGVVAAATAVTAVLLSGVLALAVAVLPGFGPTAVLDGFLAHLTAAATGTAVGLVVARPLVTRVGWSFVAATTVIMISAVQPWLPPVGAAVRSLTRDPAPTAALLLNLAVAAATLCAATALTARVAARRT